MTVIFRDKNQFHAQTVLSSQKELDTFDRSEDKCNLSKHPKTETILDDNK